MRSLVPAAALALALFNAACAEAPGAGAAGTDATTRELLATAPPGQPAADEGAPLAAAQNLDIAVLGVDRGSPDAPVRVVEFSDYGCGYCRKFHQETWPVLSREFLETGKVEWKFLPYVSGMFRNSTAATVAAECVLEQSEPLWEAMNGHIWDRQSEWKGAGDPAPLLREMAGTSGADLARYDTCLSGRRRTGRVDASTALAAQLGVRATPTFFVVGYAPIQGALPTEAFQQVLGLVYEEVTRGGTP